MGRRLMIFELPCLSIRPSHISTRPTPYIRIRPTPLVDKVGRAGMQTNVLHVGSDPVARYSLVGPHMAT